MERVLGDVGKQPDGEVGLGGYQGAGGHRVRVWVWEATGPLLGSWLGVGSEAEGSPRG